MANEFDPFYTWLGIPAAEQPPHHYRLLGLSPFESDLNAISHASDRQQSFLKLQTSGEHGQQAEQTIRAVKTAERCLLDPAQKAAYDNNLRVGLAAIPVAALPVAMPLTAPSGTPETASPFDSPFAGDPSLSFHGIPTPQSTATATPAKGKSRPRKIEPSPIGRLIAVLLPTAVTGGILFFVGKSFLGPSNSPPPNEGDKPPAVVASRTDKPEPRTPAKISNTGVTTADNPSPGDANPKRTKPPVAVPKPTGSWNNRVDGDADPQPTSPDTPKNNGGPPDPTKPPAVTIHPPLFGSGNRSPASPLDGEPMENPSADKSPLKPPSEKPWNSLTDKSPPKRAERVAVPDAAAQDAARKLVVEIFGKEIASAKTPGEKTALAAKLLQQAQETKSDPPGCYVLLVTTRDTALDAGDLDLLLRAADQIGETFDIAAAQEKLTALTTFSERPAKPSVQKATAEAALQASRDWGAAEDYDNAIAAARLAYTVVTDKKVDDARLNKTIVAQGKDLVAAKARRAAFTANLEKLKTTPDDPEANLAVGRWLWFVKQDISQGAAYLAKSGDPDLKPVAEKEVAASKDATALAALADDWWGLAQKSEAPAEKSVELRRADYWYRQASASLTGLLKAKADKRLEELAPLLAADEAAKPPSDSAPTSSKSGKAKLTAEEVRAALSGGSFEVLSREGKKEELDIWEFTAGGDVIKHGVIVSGNTKRVSSSYETIGRWDINDTKGVVRFTKLPLTGSFQLTSKTDGSGFAKTAKGDSAFGFQIKKIVPVANVVVHTLRNDVNYLLYSNGSIGTAVSPSRYWTLQGQELMIYDAGRETVFTVSEDKKTLSGRSSYTGAEAHGEVTYVDPPKE